MGPARLTRDFLARPALEVAPDLLGCLLETGFGSDRVSIRLTEVEAYTGSEDPASHAFRGPTPRTEVMFGPPGHLYVYFSYGMHHCANVVCAPAGTASAVLLRAGEVVAGRPLAHARRVAARREADLARGPARLAQALGLTTADTGVDLLDPSGGVRLSGRVSGAPGVSRGPRVGVSVAASRPWRFWVDGDPTVSAYRRSPRAAALGPPDPPPQAE